MCEVSCEDCERFELLPCVIAGLRCPDCGRYYEYTEVEE